MAGALTYDEPLLGEMPFHNVSRDGALNPSVDAMTAIRRNMPHGLMSHKYSTHAGRKAKIERARADLVEVQQAEAAAQLAADPPQWRWVPRAETEPAQPMPPASHKGRASSRAPTR